MSEKVNFFGLVVGGPGYGKTSLCAELAFERLRAGSFVLVQDVNHEFERLGTPYPTAETYLTAIAAAASEQKPITRGAALACANGADELLDLAYALGQQWNQSHGTARARICVVINEATGFGKSGSTFLGRMQNMVLNQRRHLGLELVYCLQHPAMLPRQVFDVATDVYMFNQSSSDRVRELEVRLGFERGELEPLLSLPRYRYLHWKSGIDGPRGLA